jgi:hypothetical protein
MGQPDRGALFRIDFTGPVPFEIQSIYVRPDGFRLVFTKPVDPATATDRSSYQVEHYRYEYSGQYGSPELDRTRVSIKEITIADDRRSVDLSLSTLVKDRIYRISVSGLRSAENEKLLHPTGAYTINEIPDGPVLHRADSP